MTLIPPNERHARTDRLIGADRRQSLAGAKVLIAGIGGVGGACAMALARCGIGSLTLVDCDAVAPSNLNRQWVALTSTMGQPKVEVAKRMIADIDPSVRVQALLARIDPDNAAALISGHHLLIDAVDDVKAKVALAVAADGAGVPLIASMGAGNRLDPTRFRLSDIAATHTDPLARAMRKAYKDAGIARLTVVWSDEPPQKPPKDEQGGYSPASIATVPPAAGLALAAEALRLLLNPDT